MSSFFGKIKEFLNPKDEPEVEKTAGQTEINNNEPAAQPSEKAEQEPVSESPASEKGRVEEPEKSSAEPTATASPEHKAQPESQKQFAKKQQDNVSAPQIRASVIKNIAQMLQPLLGKDDFKGLALYATQHTYAMTLDRKFQEQLRLKLDDLGFSSLSNGKIELFEKEPPADATDVYGNMIFAELLSKESATLQAPRKARISVFRGKGSLRQPEYLLDTETDKKKMYCIGRGDISTKGGLLRENDIIINDNEADPAIADLNKYVSSSHANIEVRDGGFYLRAMPGGLGTNATKYIRDGKLFKIETESMLYPLKDGDIIELGRSVMLKFEILL